MNPMILSAGIGAIGNIASTSMNNQTSIWNTKQQSKENFEYNEKAAENAFQRQLALWDKTQSPKAMVQALKEAGLSPGLLLGGAGVGGAAGSAPHGNGNSGMGAPALSPLNLMEGAALGAQIEKTKAETENIKANTAGKEAENLVYGKWGDKTMEANYNKIIAETQNTEAKTATEKLKKDYQVCMNTIAESQAMTSAEEARIKVNQAAVTYLKTVEEYKKLQDDNKFSSETFQARKELVEKQGELIAKQILEQQFKNKLNDTNFEYLVKSVREASNKAEAEAIISNWMKYKAIAENWHNKNKAESFLSPKWNPTSIANEAIGDLADLLSPLKGIIGGK